MKPYQIRIVFFMTDFRTHGEQRRQREDKEEQASIVLERLEPKIDDYKAEVKRLQDQVASLKADNEALLETLKSQMKGVEEVKAFLVERMDNLATDMDQVHRKINGIADDDLRLVKELNDNQTARLAKLSDMVSGKNE